MEASFWIYIITYILYIAKVFDVCVKICYIYTVNTIIYTRIYTLVFSTNFIALTYAIKTLLFRHSLFLICTKRGLYNSLAKICRMNVSYKASVRNICTYRLNPPRYTSRTLRCFCIRISQSVPIGFYLQRSRLLCRCNSYYCLSLVARKAIRRARLSDK